MLSFAALPMELVIISGLVAFALLFQLFATFSVRRSVSYAAEQKSAQVKLIWLLPVLGAATVLAVMFQDGQFARGTRREGSSEQRGGNGRV